MRGVLLYADGSPCPTLVLPAALLPGDDHGLIAALARLRTALIATGWGHVLKIALVGPGGGGADLTYRFVQCFPGDESRFELRGSCGHSILAAVAGAHRLGAGPQPRQGRPVTVDVRNNGDQVTCTAEQAVGDDITFTARFHRRPAPSLGSLLLFGEPVTVLDHGQGRTAVSAVSLGNPYLFVDARTLGRRSRDELFDGGAGLFRLMSGIRAAGEARLGWPRGAFPKIAALLPEPGGLAARAVSVPSWHPTLALTGATCLATAAAIPGTLPALLAGEPGGPLRITTPGGHTTVAATTTGDRLHAVAVSGKVVHLLGEVTLPSLRPVTVPAREARR
jgi:hypothetical protein